MNNKKLFASALALSMFFGLTACSSEKPEDTKVVEKKEEKKEEKNNKSHIRLKMNLVILKWLFM